MPNFRILLALLLLSTSVFAQTDCPELPQGISLVPDVETVHVDDLGSLVIYPYANDSLPQFVDDYFTIFYEFNFADVPPCFDWEYGDIESALYGSELASDSADCCGTFEIPYSVWAYGQTFDECLLTSTITITVECDQPQDCSLIDLAAAAENQSADCVPVCGGAITTVIAPFNDQLEYNWTIDGGAVINTLSNPANVEVQWDTPGEGNILVEMTGPGGTNAMQQCVDIGDAPTAAFSAPTSTCLGSPVQFTSNATVGSDHFWQFGDGETSGAVSPLHEYSASGTYTALLTVTSPLYGAEGEILCTCTDSIFQEIEVLSTTGPAIECISTLCEGDSACYWTADGCAGANYIWTAANASGSPVAFDGQGTPEICLQWGDGPHGTVSLLITGCGAPCPEPTAIQVPIISSNGTITGPEVVCESSPAVYSVPKWMDVVYNWTITGALSSQTDGNSVAVVWGSAGPGNVSVSYQSPFLGTLVEHDFPDCTGSAAMTVDIRPTLTMTAAPELGCVDATSTFSSSDAAVNWSVVPNQTGTESGSNFAIDFSNAGPHVVTAAATNPLQFCNSDVTATIVIEEVPTIGVIGPVEECAGVDLLYAVDTIPPGYIYAWSTTGANPTNSTGTNILLNWDPALMNHTVSVTTTLENAPFCSATSTLEFTPWTPTTPLELDHNEACANTLDTFIVSLSAPLNEEHIGWTIDPPVAGSIVAGQGLDTVVIQWNDFDGNVTIGLVSEVCELTSEATFDFLVHGTPELDIVQTGHLCPGAFVPATLATSPAFSSYTWSLPDWILENDSTVTTVDSVSTDPTIGDLSVFDYSVTVADQYGCEASAHYAMVGSPTPVVSISSSANLPICAGPQTDIFISAPANSNWNYDWANGETSSSFLYTLTGVPSTLSVTTTNTNTGCQSSTTQTIEADCSGGGGGGGGGDDCDPASGLVASLTRDCNTIDVTTSCTDCTDITWFFGDGSGGSGGSAHTYNEAGCYDVSAFGNVPSTTPGETCLFEEELHVCIPMAARFDVDRISCTEVQFLEATTYLDVPGEDNEIISWSWDFGDGNSSSDPNPLYAYSATGQYTVTLTATSLNGCAVSYSNALNLVFDAITDVNLGLPLCVGSPSTHVAHTPGAVSYEWDIPDGIGFLGDTVLHTFTELPMGDVITATGYDIYGCPQSTDVAVLVSPIPPDPLDGINDALLCADPGEILLESDPLFVNHQWFNHGDELPGETGPNLLAEAGKFHVFATDPEGCTIGSKQVRVQVRPDPMPNIVGPGIFCGAGEATFEVTGHYINHAWYVNGAFYTAGESLTYAGTPGMLLEVYAVVTDEDNCTHTSNLHEIEWVAEPIFNLEASTMPPCAASDVVLSISPANPAVDYFWNNGNTGTSVTTAQAGTYTATGIDENGCTHSSAFEIHPLPDLCSVPSGCYENCLPDTLCSPVELSSHQWHFNDSAIPGGLLPCLEVDQSGIYNLIASNEFGCYNESDPLELTLLSCNCDITGTVISDASCCAAVSFDNASNINLQFLEVQTGGDNATFMPSVDFTVVSSGTDFISLQYTAANNLPQGNLGEVLQLCFDQPGEHSIDWTWTGTGPSSCEGTLIWDEPGIAHTVTDEYCPGQCDGEVNTTITGGNGWTITFSDTSGNAVDAAVLCPGTYVHAMTDGGGCTFNDTLTVNGPVPFGGTVTATNALCFGDPGSICIAGAIGGTGDLTASVIPAPLASEDTCFQVAPDAYQLVLQDELGCLSAPWDVDIAEPDPIQTFAAVTPVTCHGDADGMVIVDAVGGTGDLMLASPYVFSTLPDTLPPIGGDSLALIVIDENGCTDTTLAVVSEPEPVNLTLQTLEGISCFGECTGVASFETTGGTGALGFHLGSISDSTAVTPIDFQFLCAGEQTVFLSDANGCVDSVTFEVTTSPALEFTIATEDITCTGMTDGSYQISLAGGSGNVGWIILGEAVIQNSLAEGVYFLQGFDDLDCEVDSSFEIGAETVTDMVLATFSTPVSCWESEDGTATVAVTGGNAPLHYAWTDPNGQSTATAFGLNADVYTVVVTDDIGCTLSESVEVESNEDCLFIADGITPNGDGINDTWVVGGLEFFPSSTVTVYNRWGQAMFESSPGTTPWDGTFNGQYVPSSDYYFVIQMEPGKKPITGTVTVKY